MSLLSAKSFFGAIIEAHQFLFCRSASHFGQPICSTARTHFLLLTPKRAPERTETLSQNSSNPLLKYRLRHQKYIID